MRKALIVVDLFLTVLFGLTVAGLLRAIPEAAPCCQPCLIITTLVVLTLWLAIGPARQF